MDLSKLIRLLPLMSLGLSFGDEGGGDPQKGDEGNKDTVAKAEFDAAQAELSKTKQDLEDMRLEVFSPEYMAWLDEKDKGKGGGDKGKEAPKPELTDDELKNLTPKQILEKAKELARNELKADIEAAKTAAVNTVGEEQRKREVAAFARTHEDFEKYRPVMYGLSLDPKNKEFSLQELYEASKAYIKRTAEPSEEEKKRLASMASEKPGGDSESFAKYKKMSAEDTAKESLDEVKAKLGPIPKA